MGNGLVRRLYPSGYLFLRALYKCECEQVSDEMIGLNLIYLLASGNRLSDFHMLLERVPQNEQASRSRTPTFLLPSDWSNPSWKKLTTRVPDHSRRRVRFLDCMYV